MGHFMLKMMTNVVLDKVSTVAKSFVAGATTNMIANFLGLSDSLVAKVLTVGIPAIMLIASDDPVIGGKLFDRSKKADKTRREAGGQRDDEGRRRDQEEAERGFFDVFGEKGHAMNKVIAEATGATETEVDGIMSVFLPEFERAIAEEDVEDAGALQRLFADEVAEIKEKAPRWVKMLTKAIL